MRQPTGRLLLNDIDNNYCHNDDENRNTNPGENLPASQREGKNEKREEEERDDDVRQGKPAIFEGYLAELSGTGNWSTSHERHRVPNENP